MIRWGVNTVEQDKKWRENGGTGQEVEGKRRNMIRCGGKTEEHDKMWRKNGEVFYEPNCTISDNM